MRFILNNFFLLRPFQHIIYIHIHTRADVHLKIQKKKNPADELSLPADGVREQQQQKKSINFYADVATRISLSKNV